jgi:ABC-type amino acid transport substrate-binding protein
MVPLVVAFSKEKFSKESVDAFNLALTDFRKTDEWQAILEKNGMADLVKDWPILAQ